jgi:hypothetical protein
MANAPIITKNVCTSVRKETGGRLTNAKPEIIAAKNRKMIEFI